MFKNEVKFLGWKVGPQGLSVPEEKERHSWEEIGLGMLGLRREIGMIKRWSDCTKGNMMKFISVKFHIVAMAIAQP